jgi:hypothetical protein
MSLTGGPSPLCQLSLTSRYDPIEYRYAPLSHTSIERVSFQVKCSAHFGVPASDLPIIQCDYQGVDSLLIVCKKVHYTLNVQINAPPDGVAMRGKLKKVEHIEEDTR